MAGGGHAHTHARTHGRLSAQCGPRARPAGADAARAAQATGPPAATRRAGRASRGIADTTTGPRGAPAKDQCSEGGARRAASQGTNRSGPDPARTHHTEGVGAGAHHVAVHVAKRVAEHVAKTATSHSVS
eukprot:11606018-Alexandrium_andersonii.AAC.1